MLTEDRSSCETSQKKITFLSRRGDGSDVTSVSPPSSGQLPETRTCSVRAIATSRNQRQARKTRKLKRGRIKWPRWRLLGKRPRRGWLARRRRRGGGEYERDECRKEGLVTVSVRYLYVALRRRGWWWRGLARQLKLNLRTKLR